MSKDAVQVKDQSKGSLTVWMPPGVEEEPPPDRRRWNALLTTGIKPWTRSFVWCMNHPGRWTLLCVTRWPDSITHRIRTGAYGATAEGVWHTTQRSVGGGWARVYVQCEVPPPSVPAVV